MNRMGILLILLGMAVWQFTTSQTQAAGAANNNELFQQLRIGTENRRRPYTYLKEGQIYSGILINATEKLCEINKIECEFTLNSFYHLLDDLQSFKINAFITTDSLLLPAIDRVLLSKPLCNINSVFIQRQSQQVKTKKEDFKRSTIGVLEGSLQHFYLLDEYSSLAKLKPYDLLESGILDLVFGRVDALFTDEAFFNVRVQDTSLNNDDNANQLIAVRVGQPELSPTAMRLVVRENDTELMAVLNKNILHPPPSCTDLVEQTKIPEATDSKATEKDVLK